MSAPPEIVVGLAFFANFLLFVNACLLVLYVKKLLRERQLRRDSADGGMGHGLGDGVPGPGCASGAEAVERKDGLAK